MAKELLIVKREPSLSDDPGVPEFGPHSVSIRQTHQRRPRPDELNRDALNGLRSRSVARALHFSHGLGEIPPVFFPNAEYYKDKYFYTDHWTKYAANGSMEAEKNRVDFMLGEHGAQRGFPVEFGVFVKQALSGGLASWEANSPKVAKAARKIYQDIKTQMIQKNVLIQKRKPQDI